MLTGRSGVRAATRAAAVVLFATGLAACSGGDEASDSDQTTGLPGDLTQPGAQLSMGDPARVRFEPDAKHRTQLRVTVTSARAGSVKDLAAFKLRDKARRSTVTYVRGRVANVGRHDVGGEWLKLYGRASETLVVQPVIFGSTFGKCDYKPLPKPFGTGKHADFCMVMLAPKPDEVSQVEWRFDDAQPISWAVGAHD